MVNRSGDQLKFPRGLSKKCCGHFADVDITSTFKDKYNFVHILFPSEYADSDIPIMMEYITNTWGLEWHGSVK